MPVATMCSRRRRRLGILLGAAAIWAAALPGWAKPENPLGGELAPATATAAPGETVAFELTLDATSPFYRVAVRFKAPQGTTLVQGLADQEISGLEPGRARAFRYALRVEAGGEREVWVEAEVLGLEREVVRRLFRAVLNPDASRKTRDPTIRTDPQGNRYRVQ